MGPKIQSWHLLAPHTKLRSHKLKYETEEISDVRWPFDGKLLRHYKYFGPLWKQRIYTLQLQLGGPFESKVVYLYVTLLLGPIENKVLYTLELPSVAGGKCLVCLPLLKHTTAYNPDNDLVWEYETDWTLSASSDMSTFSPNVRM